MQAQLKNNIAITYYIQIYVLVAQSCPTLLNPMDGSPPGSSGHGDFTRKNPGVGGHAILQGTFPTQGQNPGLPYFMKILYHLSHQGSPSKSMIAPNLKAELSQMKEHNLKVEELIY